MALPQTPLNLSKYRVLFLALQSIGRAVTVYMQSINLLQLVSCKPRVPPKSSAVQHTLVAYKTKASNTLRLILNSTRHSCQAWLFVASWQHPLCALQSPSLPAASSYCWGLQLRILREADLQVRLNVLRSLNVCLWSYIPVCVLCKYVHA